MAVNTLTLYMPGSSVGIQVYEGSQLHLILVSQGANSVPSAPGQTVRADPFPQYVDADELAAALAGVDGVGGGAVNSVNGKTGSVTLTFSDVGAVSDTDPRLSDARIPTLHTHGVTDLTVTGTASATTFLRGDSTWAVPAGGGGGATSDLRAFNVFAPENYGAVGDGVADDGAAVNNCLAAAGAVSGVVWFEAGRTYKSTVQIVQPNGLVQIEGNGGTIQFTSASFDLVSLGPEGLSDIARTGGYVRRLQVRGPGGDDSNAFAPTNRKAGIVWNSTRHARTEDCYVTNVDIAYDLRGNCYGSKFLTCRTGVTTNVGILLRGGSGLIAGSGSDIQVDGFWGGGARAAFWIEGNAGGYWFVDCKPGGGHNQYATDQDGYGVWVAGPTYDPQTTVTAAAAGGTTSITVADATKVFSGRILINGQEINVTSKSGNVLTVPALASPVANGAGVQVVNGVGNVSIVGGGIEGTTRVHAIRLYEDVAGFGISEFSFNSNGGNDATAINQMLSVIKHTWGAAPSISMRRCLVQGRWRQASPITLTQGYGNNAQFVEEGTTHGNATAPVFAGTTMSLFTRPLSSWSNVPGATATGKYGVYTGGRGVRVNSGALEVSTDSTLSAWAAAGGGGAASTNEFPGPVKVVNSAYTLTLADAGGLVTYDVGGTAGTYTLPTGVSPGYTVSVSQGFSGQLTVTAAGSDGPDGIRTPTGIFTTVKTKSSGSVLKFVKDAGTRWYLLPYGDSYVAP